MGDFKSKVETYIRNMNKYEKDIDIHVRFLDKIFATTINEDCKNEEKISILKILLNQANNESDNIYKILDLCFAYKINKRNNLNVDTPILRSKETIKGGIVFEREIPGEIAEKIKNRPLTQKFYEFGKMDEEAFDLFNIKIAKDHFLREV